MPCLLPVILQTNLPHLPTIIFPTTICPGGREFFFTIARHPLPSTTQTTMTPFPNILVIWVHLGLFTGACMTFPHCCTAKLSIFGHHGSNFGRLKRPDPDYFSTPSWACESHVRIRWAPQCLCATIFMYFSRLITVRPMPSQVFFGLKIRPM